MLFSHKTRKDRDALWGVLFVGRVARCGVWRCQRGKSAPPGCGCLCAFGFVLFGRSGWSDTSTRLFAHMQATPPASVLLFWQFVVLPKGRFFPPSIRLSREISRTLPPLSQTQHTSPCTRFFHSHHHVKRTDGRRCAPLHANPGCPVLLPLPSRNPTPFFIIINLSFSENVMMSPRPMVRRPRDILFTRHGSPAS